MGRLGPAGKAKWQTFAKGAEERALPPVAQRTGSHDIGSATGAKLLASAVLSTFGVHAAANHAVHWAVG